jgi:protoheme IX farnesyltransferase
MIKDYYVLTKPGIIYGNAMTTIAGFLLASKGMVNIELLVFTFIGISLVIASGCVYNNYLDRKIDEKMERTKKRALVAGRISGRNALIYATILGLLGITILFVYTNALTTALAVLGHFFYVVVYGYFKRHSTFGTIVGSIPGAVPIIVGYCAVTNRIDLGAVLLFLILVVWQMPHFYAIGIYRLKDYAAAGIPILPVEKGIEHTKIQMLFYIAAFIITTVLLFTFGYTGYGYLAIACILGIAWFVYGIRGIKTKDTDRWARKMFALSLINLLIFSIIISVSVWIV